MSLPPITCSIIAVCCFLSILMNDIGVHPHNFCINERIVLSGGYSRLFFSVFFHASWPHLFYNMISFYKKGKTVESLLGPFQFSVLTLSSIIFGNLIYVITQAMFRGSDMSSECAVGLSGVIFAIQVAISHFVSSEQKDVEKNILWTELIMSYLLVPNSSLLGHMSGVVAGYIYVWFIHPILFSRDRARTRFYQGYESRNSYFPRLLQVIFYVAMALIVGYYLTRLWGSYRHAKTFHHFIDRTLREIKLFWDEELKTGDFFYNLLKSVRIWLKRHSFDQYNYKSISDLTWLKTLSDHEWILHFDNWLAQFHFLRWSTLAPSFQRRFWIAATAVALSAFIIVRFIWNLLFGRSTTANSEGYQYVDSRAGEAAERRRNARPI